MSTRGLNKRQDQLLTLVLQLQPVSIFVLAERVGLTINHVRVLLRQLRDRKLVATSQHGRGALWSDPIAAAVMREANREMREADRAMRRRRKSNQEHQRRLMRATDWHAQCVRIVPANEAPPIKTTAANSVFNLAQSAA